MAALTQDQLDQLKAAAEKEKARAPGASTPGYALPTAPAAPDGAQPQPPPDQGQQIGRANAAAAGITTPAGPRSLESASTPGYGITTLPAPAAPDGNAPPSQTPQAQTPAQTPQDNEFSNPGTNIPAGYRAPAVKAEPTDDELNQKSADDLFPYFSTSNDVNPDRAAAFWQNKKNQELSNQSFDNNKAVLWNDLSNVWNKIVQTKGVVPNTINYFKSIVNSLGGSGDDVLQAFGNQNAIDYRQDLDGKLANNTISQQTHDQSMALVDQAQKLQDKLAFEKLSPQEQQDIKVQIAGLLTKSDSDFAQHQQTKAFQQVFTGLNLTWNKMRAVSHALDDFDNYDLNPPGFDWQKYFTGRDSAASWPTKKLAAFFSAHRPVAQAISQGESGQVPGWVKGFNQWDIDWKKRMGLLPSTAEYASPEQLAKEGSPISTQRIQDTSDISNLALQLALDPALGIENSMELASSKLLGGSAKVAGLGPPIAGLTQKLWNSGVMEPIRRGVAYYETFFQHNPMLGLAWTMGGGMANLGLGAYRRWGHLASDVLDDAAKMNFEQGGPMSLLSRGARLTSDSIVHSLPYALLNSDGDSNRFWDNLTTLAPVQFAARAIPQAGQAVGTELGDNLFGRLGEFRDTTPVDYPGPDPNLNAHSQANLQDVPRDEKNQFATLQHFQNGNTRLYLVTPEVADDYQARFGGDAQPRPYGFWVGPDRTGTGQGAAFVLKDRIKEAAGHEATHGVFFSASKEDQEALMNNALKYNDPDKFIQDHYNQKATYASLPEDAPSADPTMLSKKLVRTEMAVESLKQWFNARNAEQYTKQNPGLLRSIRMVAGSWLERIGIPTQTFKSTSEMGINPYFANGLISDGLWRKAARGYQMNPKDPSWPVGNWPLNPGDTWDTTGRPPPKTPPPTTPPPKTPPTPTTPAEGALHEQQTGMSPEVQAATGKGPTATPVDESVIQGLMKQGFTRAQAEAFAAKGTVSPVNEPPKPTEPAPPTAPPAQEEIARRAYEISQEREQKGTPGDHVSDWHQAETELRGGKTAPKAGPEAPAPETPASNTPDYHAQLEELRKKGVPAGEAQAIVEGRQPKTLEQEQGPAQMPGKRGAKGPIVSSPKPVWGPGAGIFGTAANALSPPTLIGAQRTNALPPNQGPETVGTLPPPAPSYGAPPTRAQQPAKTGYGAPPTRQQPTEQKTGYGAPPTRTQPEVPKPEVKPEPSPAVAPAPKKAAVAPSADSRTVTSTEFGFVDRAAVAAHPEKYPSKNRGFSDFGSQDLSGENTKGVSVPPEDLQAHFGNNAIYRDKNGAWHASPRFAQMVKNHDVMVEVTNPANGKKDLAPIVDIGPTKSTGAGLDVLHGTAQSIGFTSGKQALSYRFAGGEMPQGAPYKGYSNLADAAEANVGRLNTVQDPGTNGGELACADAVTRIVRGQMHIDLPRTLSTATLHNELEDGASKGWYQKVPINTPGAIVVSPSQGEIHGHTGIVGKDGKSIYSNSSKDGNWEKNYTTEGWQNRFGNNVYAYLPTDKAPQVKPGEEDKWASGEGPQAGGGEGTASGGGGGGGGGGGAEVPYSPLPPMPAQEEEKSAAVPGMEEAEREGAATGGGSGGYAEEPATHMTPFASMYPFGMPSAAQMRAPMTQGEAIQQSQMGAASTQAPAAPGGLYYMRGPKLGGITPEEEGGAPTESTLGEPNVKGFGKLKSLLTQGYGADNITKAQKLHASLLSSDDTRVKKQADNMFKGEHFLAGDPMHQHMLAELPENERVALAAGQTAIQNKKPMHLSYISAPPGPGKESAITRQSREVNYDASSPQARLLGQTNGRLAGDSMIPTAIGIGKNRAKGMAQNSSGYLQGISTSVAAHNHAKLNEALSEMGQESPYPELGHAKFRNDLSGYVQNLLAGHKGTGKGYQAGTAEYPANPDRKYVPYRLKQRESDFLNAVINNQAARHSKGYQALAKAGGTLLNEEGEVNPMRRDIDAHMAGLRGGKAEEIKDDGIKKAANERWSKQVLEPTIRTYNAGLIHALHETPEHIPTEIRPKVPGYEKLTETLGRELTTPKGRPDVPVGVHFMPAPLSPEEHKELTGNIRKQFISGKLRPKDYLERIGEVPEPGESLGGIHYMPMAGKKARGFAQAEKEGRTFETPLPGGGQRFEIDDRDMSFKPPSKPGVPGRNALEERYNSDKRGPGILPLADAVRHPDLFENYPFLRSTKISMDPTIPHYGHYEPPWLDKEGNMRGDHVVLKSPTDKETLAHEVQHAVQHYEKFAGTGTNPDHIYARMYNDTAVHDELRKQWDAAYPERASMSEPEFDRNENERFGWMNQRMKEMAHAMYQMDPGEIEARAAGKRAIRLTPEQREEARAEVPGWERAGGPGEEQLRETTPKEDVLEEMRGAVEQGRHAGTVSGLPGISYMPGGIAKSEAAPKKVPAGILKQIGERPEDEEQGKLHDRISERLASQIEGAIPLRADRGKQGEFKTDSKGNPLYEKENYDLANAPILGKKALGFDEKGSVNKAPKGTVDKLDKDDLKYLNPTDRLRVSHLNEISAVDTFAKKLGDMYDSLKDIPEVMHGKDWYNDTEGLLKKHFGGDADLVANLLAATSANTNVKVNYKLGMQAYHQYLRGDFDRHAELYNKAYDLKQKGALAQHVLDAGIHHELPKTEAEAMARYIKHHDILPSQESGALFGMNSLPVLKVLAHTWHQEVGGPKTPNYAGNLSGKTLQATIDMWAARTMRRLGYEGQTKKPWLIQPGAETGVTNPDFALSQLAFRKAAAEKGLEPRQLQSILWFAEQKHYQNQGWEREIDPAERDYRPNLKKYERPSWAEREPQAEAA
jgi:hypothetical protein